MRIVGVIGLLVALASSGSLAADPNGYTAKYECRAGGLHCDVDVAELGNRACDQIISAWTPWSAIDWSNNTICIEAGDHTPKGTLTIAANGSPQARKVLRYYRSGDTDDEPWNQSAANQATIQRIVATGSYWVIHRLRIARSDSSGANETYGNNIWNRMLIENSTVRLFRFRGRSDTLQNSVIRKAGDNFAPSTDQHCTDSGGGNVSNSRLVNNEIYDCTGDAFQNNKGTDFSGFVIENNDMYLTSDYTALAQAGKACAEQGIDIKQPGATSGNPAKIVHNRIWRFKKTDTSCGGTGSSGEGIIIHGDGTTAAGYVLVSNNIFIDLPAAVGMNAQEAARVSVIGNLIFNINDASGTTNAQAFKVSDANAAEFYLNTVIRVDGNWGNIGAKDSDFRCNVFIDALNYTGTPEGGTEVNSNAYYGVPGAKLDSHVIDNVLMTRVDSKTYSAGDIIRTSASPNTACTAANESSCFLYKVTAAGTSSSSKPAYCTVPGCTTSDGAIKVTPIRGPYAFYRKLRTGPELVVIPYAVPYVNPNDLSSSADEAYGCPPTFAMRPGIGVSDAN